MSKPSLYQNVYKGAITRGNVAEVLHTTSAQITKHIRAGKIRYFRVPFSNEIRIPVPEILLIILQCKTPINSKTLQLLRKGAIIYIKEYIDDYDGTLLDEDNVDEYVLNTYKTQRSNLIEDSPLDEEAQESTI